MYDSDIGYMAQCNVGSFSGDHFCSTLFPVVVKLVACWGIYGSVQFIFRTRGLVFETNDYISRNLVFYSQDFQDLSFENQDSNFLPGLLFPGTSFL